MKKIRILSVFGLLFLIAVVWYLFIKKADYIYQFKEKGSPGTIFFSITHWEETNDSIETTTIDSTLYSSITQHVRYKGENYTLFWDINSINDSVSEVQIGVKQQKRSIKNRLTAPFVDTPFKENTKEFLIDFRKTLQLNLSTFKVSIEGESGSPNKKCACVNAITTPEGKAKQMMRNYNYINSFINTHKLEADGRPMVIINEFDRTNNTIDMDFCFPIKGIDKVPGTGSDLFIKNINSGKAVKAIFNGNYMYSHHAWYQLINYAEMHQLDTDNSFIEVFHNNPNMGGDALKWQADIYMFIHP